LIKNSQTFGKKCQKTLGFFDSHCIKFNEPKKYCSSFTDLQRFIDYTVVRLYYEGNDS